MNSFAKLHPVTKSAFFICAFVLTLCAANPVFSIISLCAVLLYSMLDGVRAFFSSLKLAVVITVLVSVFNMLFAHYGVDVLFTVKDVEFTLEALFYGFNQGLVMSAVMLWFKVMSYTVDSAETAYLLRFAPKLALLFSMVLGFLPRFKNKLGDIRDAQKGLSHSEPQTSKSKMKTAVRNLSALISYSLESSIITADSMSARGYNPKCSSRLRYKLSKRDIIYLALFIAAFALTIFAQVTDKIGFIFEPRIYFATDSIVYYFIFAAVMLLPLIIEVWEVLLWKRAVLKA